MSLVARFAVDEEEVANYYDFKKHHICNSEKRLAMWEEDCTPVFTELCLVESTIGINVIAKCRVCGTTEVLNSKHRNDSF